MLSAFRRRCRDARALARRVGPGKSMGWLAKPSAFAPGASARSRLACRAVARRKIMFTGVRRLERETGIEPATNSLEGCDSTTELLPPWRLAGVALRRFGVAGPQSALSPTNRYYRALPLRTSPTWPAKPKLAAKQRAKVGGEGRTRTFEAARATDLQSAAFDRFATSPASCGFGKRAVSVVPATGEFRRRSWRRDSNPRPADYKSAALPD
jgi:hypothetical protein